jgi:hypothetical protein
MTLLKAVGAFKPLPIAASRTVKLGGTVNFPSLVTRHSSHLWGLRLSTATLRQVLPSDR